MKQYLDLVQHVLDHGTRKPNRTGVDTLSTFGYYYEHDLADGFPLLTTKTVSWKNIVVEMLWFLSGQTDIAILKRHGCKFWDAWADANGKVPSAYGNFWRRFPVHGTRSSSDMQIDGDDCLAYNDQIVWALDELKRNPMSRRVVVSAWAPGNAQTSKLPPCHCQFIFNVQNTEETLEDRLVRAKAALQGSQTALGEQVRERILDWHLDTPDGRRLLAETLTGAGFAPAVTPRLCLHLTQRSCDVALGVPYNIASYALLMELFSRFTGIAPGAFGHTLVDAHVYTAKANGEKAEFDHVPGLREQVQRKPRRLPRLKISGFVKSLADVETLMRPDVSTEEILTHFVLEGYDPHPAIPFKVAV